MKNIESQNDYTKLGKRIAKYRKENNLSQKKLSEKIGISQQLLANYELGQRRIHVFILLKIATILNVTIFDLLGIKSKKVKPGPIPKIQKILEEIQGLPINKQKMIIESIDAMIKGMTKKAS